MSDTGDSRGRLRRGIRGLRRDLIVSKRRWPRSRWMLIVPRILLSIRRRGLMGRPMRIMKDWSRVEI